MNVYIGQVDSQWPDGWQNIGHCDADGIDWGRPPPVREPRSLSTRTFRFQAEPDPLKDLLAAAVQMMPGPTLTFQIPIKTISPPVFRLMFGIRHPKLRDMHCAYARRVRARRRRSRRH